MSNIYILLTTTIPTIVFYTCCNEIFFPIVRGATFLKTNIVITGRNITANRDVSKLNWIDVGLFSADKSSQKRA